MNIKEIKDWFKERFNWNESISIGKIDKTKEKAICFYNNNDNVVPKIELNNKNSYVENHIKILLRWKRNANDIEIKAKEIYDFLHLKTYNNWHFIAEVLPVDVGTDDKGIYEYVLKFKIYENMEE